MIKERAVACALLWLRNHYEAGNPELKPRVIETIDLILQLAHPTGTEMREFRNAYLHKVEEP